MKKLILFALLAVLTACTNKTKTPPADTKPPAATEPAAPVKPAATEPAKEPVPPEPTTSTAPKTDSAAASKSGTAKPDAKVPDVPTAANKPTRILAHFQTNMGNFTAELNEKEAPITVANFVGLASGQIEWTDIKTNTKQKKPLYDGLTFHRIIGSRKFPPQGFMIQGGDPLGSGQGGPGFSIKDEYNNLKHDKAGTLAMARTSAPNSAGSQFYVTLNAQAFLDNQVPPYVVFGYVTEGMDVVTKIGEVQTDGSDKPVSPVIINKITIERK